MPVFTYVYKEHIAIPTATTFGAKSSPSFYMLPGELRAWLASTFQFTGAATDLTDQLEFVAPLSSRECSRLQRANSDRIHQGAQALLGEHRLSLSSSFVDDTFNANTGNTIGAAILQSVLSAYIVFGFPGEDIT